MKTSDGFKTKLKTYTSIIDKRLCFHTSRIPEKINILKESIDYAFFPGGKILRPSIMLNICEMFNGNIEDILDCASSIEFIHTYSLIHDDLPSMDNDDLRRGKATLHKAFGEDIAILSGDALLNMAFEIISDQNIAYEDKNILDAIKLLSKSSGYKGMLGGQIIDINQNGNISNIDDLLYLHSKKTGALIKASGLVPLILMGKDENTIGDFDRFLELVGVAFQVKDDILDIEGEASVLGKPINSDIKNNKKTFIDILGISGSKEYMNNLINEAVEIIKKYDNSEFLINLANYVGTREY